METGKAVPAWLARAGPASLLRGGQLEARRKRFFGSSMLLGFPVAGEATPAPPWCQPVRGAV